MDTRHLIFACAAFILLVVGMFGTALVLDAGEGAASEASHNADSVAGGSTKELETYVLSGYEVELWGDGRPFVRYYDPGAMEYASQDIYQALFWQSQYAGGDMAQMGGAPAKGPVDGAEAAYRLGLICEHGLFGYRVDRDDALRNYRTARMAGHAVGDEAASRLESGGA